MIKRWLLSTAALVALFAPATNARPAFFWTATEGSQLALDYLRFEESTLGARSKSVDGTRSVITGQYDFSGDRGWVLGAGHEYNALDFSGDAAVLPATNGDLHTLHLATQWHRDLAAGRLRFALAPALSVSSNALKNPDQLDSAASQLWGALMYRSSTEPLHWLAGMAHDYRWGEGRVYPVAGLEWRTEALFLRATYPDLLLSLELGPRWILAVNVAPDGNEWRAWDREMVSADAVRREAWQADARFSYRFDRGFRLGISAGYHWDQEWRFRQMDGETGRYRGDSSYLLGLHLSWHPSS